ncbi:hypothetical protein U9M48_031257 [Paspalum notatum var. saurae]|uniref:Uncharacterized protein n=1 Tax=Paspalum notatum var. saurae TaxID=547442 RepID=A0AAQ3U5H6_PASNO
MDEQPPLLFGVPLPFKKRKAADLIDGVPVLDSTLVTPPESPRKPEIDLVPPPDLAEPLTQEEIPSSTLELLSEEEPFGTQVRSPLIEPSQELASPASPCCEEEEDSVASNQPVSKVIFISDSE